MAIYHLHVGFISRSTGRSAVQSAAYITGEKLHESRRDLTANYQNRHSDIAFTATLAPKHAPEAFHSINVWDLLENFEDAYANQYYKTDKTRETYLISAQTAQTIVMALPRELNVSVAKELVEEFALTRFVARGLIVTYAIHDDEGNPHAHLQISRRAVREDGTLALAKDREIVSRKELLVTRKLWADLTNLYLEREGFVERITHKSFADLGIQLEPTHHRGWIADKLADIGITSRIVLENKDVFDRNRETLLERPEAILEELTTKKATFCQMDLLKAVQKRVGDDSNLVAFVFERALHQAVRVGEGMDGNMRYTSSQYQEIEAKAVQQLEAMSGSKTESFSISAEQTKSYLDTNYAHLSPEQQEAVRGLTQSPSLSVLVGRAGAGKTTTLKAVSELYTQSGYSVIGASLSAHAADNLGTEANITSKTLHSWLYQWDRYQAAQEKFLSFDNVMEEGVFKQLDWYKDLKAFEKSQLTHKHVLIVDEAGMVGTRQWSELLTHVQKSGAKLIAVGDDHQFKAIEAGDFFRELKTQADQNGQLYQLQKIRRQQHAWMREASDQLAELYIQEGLSAYERRGHIHQTTRENLSADIAAAYLGKIKTGQDGLVLAFTHTQTQEINSRIREHLRSEGMIGQEDIVTLNGQRFAIGDRIVFLENDKHRLTISDAEGRAQKDVYIKNGSSGVIQFMNENGDIVVALKDNLFTVIPCKSQLQKIAIGQPNPEPIKEYAYTAITHGYSITCHKAQGQTVDFTLIAGSRHMDAKGIYVAMTRHREDVQLFYTQEDFKTFKALTHHLSRFEHKDLVKDYTIRPENEEAWQRVQEYKLCILDASAVLKAGTKNNTVDWEAYNQIKKDQIRLGKEILDSFDKHQLYLDQAGLTEEMLQITTGAKTRPLSKAEEKAKLTVEFYGEMARNTRELWNTIRKTHHGAKCHEHPLYPTFKEQQEERNALAHTISENYGLHRPFVHECSRVFGINKKTVEAQSKKFSKVRNVKTDQLPLRSYQKPYGMDLHQRSYEKQLIKEELNAQIKNLAYEFLGRPTSQKATEWRYGKKGSISIHVAGSKQGLYSNFETGESGNALKLIQDHLSCDYKEAFKWGAAWLGHGYTGIRALVIQEEKKTLPRTKEEWTPIYPAPHHPVDLKAEKHLAYMLKGRQETARYAYKDADGHILGYVVRLEDKQGHKITPTLTYCENHQGERQWRWQGFGQDRPLYGLEVLKEKLSLPVLIVEGEKTCELARELFPDHAVVTWSGGCGAVRKSDWSVLKGRDVKIWPDHDSPGIKAANKIADILKGYDPDGKSTVRIVDLPPTLPHKWDLADKIPAHVDIRSLLEGARPLLEKVELCESSIQKISKTYRLGWLYKEGSAHHYQLMNHAFKEELRRCHHLGITLTSQDKDDLKDHSVLFGLFYGWAQSHAKRFKMGEEGIQGVAYIAAHLAQKNPDRIGYHNTLALLLHAKDIYTQGQDYLRSEEKTFETAAVERILLRENQRSLDLFGKPLTDEQGEKIRRDLKALHASLEKDPAFKGLDQDQKSHTLPKALWMEGRSQEDKLKQAIEHTCVIEHIKNEDQGPFMKKEKTQEWGIEFF